MKCLVLQCSKGAAVHDARSYMTSGDLPHTVFILLSIPHLSLSEIAAVSVYVTGTHDHERDVGVPLN